jgi:hypothetical protein
MKESGYRPGQSPHGAFNNMFYTKLPSALRSPARRLLESLYYSGGPAGYQKLFPKRSEMAGATDGCARTTADFLVFGIYAPVFDPEIVSMSKGRKALFLVRKPLDYLYSYFVHEQKNFWRESVDRRMSFDAFVKNPFALFQQSREESIKSLIGNGAAALFPEVDFRTDDVLILPWVAYARYLKLWLKELGPENVMIIHSEEFYVNTQEVMDKVFSFLNMAPHKISNRSIENANVYERTMSPETRAHVQRCVKPYNEELYELLGRNLGWDE